MNGPATRTMNLGRWLAAFAGEPSASLFYPALGHVDCAERLRRAVSLRTGFALVAGERGLGKTTIALTLLAEWQANPALAVAEIASPRDVHTNGQFMRAVLAAFGAPAGGRSALDLTNELGRALIAQAERGRRGLLVIDNGQELSGAQLELLRTFLLLEAPRGLLDIVVFAEPELRDKIGRKRHLAMRLATDHTLNPLNRRDTAGLIQHRLGLVAGGGDGAIEIFTPGAIDAIHERSRGVPGAIVQLCHDAIASAVNRSERQVTEQRIAAVAPLAFPGVLAPIQVRLPLPDQSANGRSHR